MFPKTFSVFPETVFWRLGKQRLGLLGGKIIPTIWQHWRSLHMGTEKQDPKTAPLSYEKTKQRGQSFPLILGASDVMLTPSGNQEVPSKSGLGIHYQ